MSDSVSSAERIIGQIPTIFLSVFLSIKLYMYFDKYYWRYDIYSIITQTYLLLRLRMSQGGNLRYIFSMRPCELTACVNYCHIKASVKCIAFTCKINLNVIQIKQI